MVWKNCSLPVITSSSRAPGRWAAAGASSASRTGRARARKLVARMDLFPCGGAEPVDRWPAPMSASALLGRRGVGGALAPLLVRRSGAVLAHREGRRRRFRRPGRGGHEDVTSLSGVIITEEHRGG